MTAKLMGPQPGRVAEPREAAWLVRDDRRVVEILAIPPKPPSGWFWSLAFVAWVLDAISGGGVWEGGGSKAARVVVAYRGKRRLLFKETSFEIAKEKERVAAEYEAMEPEEWCKRYGVPRSFFSD